MASKLAFLALLAVLMLANVHGEDDFKDVDDGEDLIVEPEIEDDEEYEPRPPRTPIRWGRSGGRSRSGGWGRSGGRSRWGGWGRSGGGSRFGRSRFGSRAGTRSGGSFRVFRRNTARSRSGGIFRRNSGSSRSGGIFRRNSGSSRSSGSFRIFRRNSGSSRSGGIFRRNTGSSRSSGGFRIFRRNSGSSRSSGGFRIFRRNSGSSRSSGGIFRRNSGSSRSGGFRIFRRNSGSSRSSGGGLFRRSRKTQKSSGGAGGTDIWGKIGTVISLASFGSDIARTTLQHMSNVEKKIVVSIANLEGVSWEGNTVYMNEGSNLKAFPTTVEVTEGVLAGGEKTPGPSRSGVAGVVCYRMQDIAKSFCLMYKVPWSGDNYWNVKVYDGSKAASSDVYNELQNDAMRAGTPVAQKDLGQGSVEMTNDDGSKQTKPYRIFMKDVSMTNAGAATLQISLGVKITGTPTPKVDDERKINVDLQNANGVDWEEGTFYMNEGAGNSDMPKSVETGDGYDMALLQKDGENKKGVSGVICYYLSNILKSFCLMFKVPYNVDNKWNVKVYDGETKANANVYNTLQTNAIDEGNAIGRKDLYQGTLDGTPYKIYMEKCNMDNSPKASLNVTIGVEA